eukprot:1712380-Rhodomonas_salina.4
MSGTDLGYRTTRRLPRDGSTGHGLHLCGCSGRMLPTLYAMSGADIVPRARAKNRIFCTEMSVLDVWYCRTGTDMASGILDSNLLCYARYWHYAMPTYAYGGTAGYMVESSPPACQRTSPPILLPACYAVSGTAIGYAARTWRAVLG